MTNDLAIWLVDTNIVVYAYDASDVVKQQRAADVVDRLQRRRTGALSTQILGEFYNTVTRRIPAPLSPREGELRILRFMRSWRVLNIEGPTVIEAAHAAGIYQLSYWDALIWATAKLNGIPHVLSEDFSDGRLIENVRFLNPLAPSFNMEELRSPS